MAKKMKTERAYTINDVVVRLDIIIRLLLESNTENEKFNKASIIPTFNSIGLEPADIAKIYGKTTSAEISSSLYRKKKGVDITKQ